MSRNILIAKESKSVSVETEYTPRCFSKKKKNVKALGHIDLFASELNGNCKHYVSCTKWMHLYQTGARSFSILFLASRLLQNFWLVVVPK